MNTSLPIYPSMAEIVEAVRDNETVVITAETGSGKSTQVPQYLYNAGYNTIITQPRRIACVTLADRVSKEIGADSEVVGYQTAFESTRTPNTKILFCTDGLQLARGIHDSNSVLIIDELHEWNLAIETLVAWIKKFRKDGNSIKVVLMSATIDASDLLKFYGDNSIRHINVPGRLFHVEKNFIEVSDNDDFDRKFHKEILNSIYKGKNVLAFRPGKREISETIGMLDKLLKATGERAVVLPMHGELPIEEQNKCFEKYNVPKVVVATNIAQTSITIPDINVVVDDGIEKRIITQNGIENLSPDYISKADIEQRAGRAGRVAEGEYYLFSQWSYNLRDDYATAEINRLILDKVVLKLYSVGIDAEEIEFYHQPEKEKITEAKDLLKLLGAIDDNGITSLGKTLIGYPVSVRCSKIIETAKQYGIVDDMLKVVSIIENNSLVNFKHEVGMTIGDIPFTRNVRYSDFTKEERSDLLAELDIFERILRYEFPNLKEAGLNKKSFFRIKDFYKKLSEYVNAIDYDGMNHGRDNEEYYKNFLKCLYAGNPDRVFESEPGGMGRRYYGPCGGYMYSKNTCVKKPQENPPYVMGMPRIISYIDKYECMRTLPIIDSISGFPKEWLDDILDQSRISVHEHEPMYYSWSESFIIRTDVVYMEGLVLRTNERRVEKYHPEFKTLVEEYKETHPWARTEFDNNNNDDAPVVHKQTHLKIEDREHRIITEPDGKHVYFSFESDIQKDRHEKYTTDDGETIILHYDTFKDVNPAMLWQKIFQHKVEVDNRRILSRRKIKEVKTLDVFEAEYYELMGSFLMLDDDAHNISKYYGLTITKDKVWSKRFDSEEEYLTELTPAIQKLFKEWVSENCKTSDFCFIKHGRKITNKSTEECKAVFLDFLKETTATVTMRNLRESKDFIKKAYQECIDAMEENPW